MKAAASSHPAILIAIAYLGFISLGLPDTVLGVAWPSVRGEFHREQKDAALLFFGTGASYFLSSLFAGEFLKRAGVGLLLAVSSALVACSGLGYGSATLWLFFAACSLLHGLGSGAIDTGLNHYVAHHLGPRHMNWLHACYSIGAMLGPAIMTACLAEGFSWRWGYLTVAGLLVVLSMLFAATQRMWDGAKEPQPAAEPIRLPLPARSPRQNWLLGQQVLLFFLYTGAEVTIGQWSFTLLTEGRGVTKEVGGTLVTLYWSAIAAGRIGSGFVVNAVGPRQMVRLGAGVAMAGAALFAMKLSTAASCVGLVLAGVGLAPIYPCVMTVTPQRLGAALASNAIGVQVGAAMLGAAALPSIAAAIAQGIRLESAALFMAILAALVFALHEAILQTERRGVAIGPRG